MKYVFLPILLLTCSSVLLAQESSSSRSEVAAQSWDRLFYTKDREPVSISMESETGKALLNSFNPVLKKTLPANLKLVGELRAFKNWVIFRGYTANAAGAAALPEGGITSDTTVLFLSTKSGWVVVDFGIGHSDMFFVEWPAQYAMPEDLLKPSGQR
jgi:hypothetical protein